MNVQIPLGILTNPNEGDLAKIILSSADHFPGLYRFSSSFKDRLDSPDFMKWLNFFETAYRTSLKNQKWTREEWFRAQEIIFEIGFGKGSRNEDRDEDDLKSILKARYQDWFRQTNSFRLAVIDHVTAINEIEVNKTYYMMGSLLHFKYSCFEIGWDAIARKSYQTIQMPFEQVKTYIQQIYSEKTQSELFFKAEVVGHLSFSKDNFGSLSFDMKDLESRFGEFSPQSIIFASNIYNFQTPIQFAKPIGVSNVCA